MTVLHETLRSAESGKESQLGGIESGPQEGPDASGVTALNKKTKRTYKQLTAYASVLFVLAFILILLAPMKTDVKELDIVARHLVASDRLLSWYQHSKEPKEGPDLRASTVSMPDLHKKRATGDVVERGEIVFRDDRLPLSINSFHATESGVVASKSRFTSRRRAIASRLEPYEPLNTDNSPLALTCTQQDKNVRFRMTIDVQGIRGVNHERVEASLYDSSGLVAWEREILMEASSSQQRIDRTDCIGSSPENCYTFVLRSRPGLLYGNYSIKVQEKEENGFWKEYLVTKIGKSICGFLCEEHKPLVAPVTEPEDDALDTRSHQIVTVLISLSGSAALANIDSPQYKAACWLLHDDLLQRGKNGTEWNSVDSDLLVQRYVLALLFYSTNGEQWEGNLGFLSPESECKWNRVIDPSDPNFHARRSMMGVQCTGTTPAHVNQILIWQNNLQGSIVSEISKLRSLKILDLLGNELSGEIPPSLGELSGLAVLDLACNRLEGHIPEELFHLSYLGYLSLDSNDLTGSLSEKVNDMSVIDHLSLRENVMTGTIPSSLFLLPTLRKLALSGNMLTGTIPFQKINTSSMTDLYLSSNSLSGFIDDNVGHLTELITLDVSNNTLEGMIPTSMENLRHLSDIRLHHNKLRGDVPNKLCDIIEDKKSNGSRFTADCDANSVEPIRCSCCKCFGPFSFQQRNGVCRGCNLKISIQVKREEHEKLEWTLQDGYDNETVLEHFPYLGPGVFQYDICTSKTNCFFFKADSRHTHSISIDGETVDCSGKKSLKFGYSVENGTLALQRCDPITVCDQILVEGVPERRIIDKLAEVSGIETLNDTTTPQNRAACWIIKNWNKTKEDKVDLLDDMSLVVQQYVLALLHFSYNTNIFGTTLDFDETEGISYNGSHVVSIRLPKKNLTGTLPHELGKLPMLETLNLNSNNLGGTIPVEISNLWNLGELDLGNNFFTGKIPTHLGGIEMLKTLVLSSKELTGVAPSDLFALSSLSELDLSNNRLSGSILMGIGLLSSLDVVDLSSNQLTGSFPSEISTASNVRQLRLDRNRLTGRIPKTIGSMKKLEELLLHDNRLTGRLPHELGKLTSISNLTLSYNSLKGIIPAKLGDLTNVRFLNLHGNQFTGTAPVIKGHQDLQFVTDCGTPPVAAEEVTCGSCTVCCNSLELCRENPTTLTPIEITGFVMAGLVWLMAMYYELSNCLFECFPCCFCRGRDLPTLCGKDSVYSFLLSPGEENWRKALKCNITRWFLVLCTVCFQVVLFLFFVLAANAVFPTTDWQYMVRCPRNRIECFNDKEWKVTWEGWVVFSVLMLAKLGSDLIHGCILIYIAASQEERYRCLLCGIILLVVTVLAICSSVLYNFAIATTNTRLIINAVIILFVNDMDRQVFSLLKAAFPNWVENKVQDAKDYGKKKKWNDGNSGLASIAGNGISLLGIPQGDDGNGKDDGDGDEDDNKYGVNDGDNEGDRRRNDARRVDLSTMRLIPSTSIWC